ncbi:DMT family transporter [Bacillus sp. FJAT-42376]|uniref:DMT family transporter n=1 Tax=Bacillus sp. FJAT-42376 TaxID=2014076 RepID=UPI000F4EDFD7|nr:DMT family transporter [Bacillus sp. FJAT-42376]AZB41035.1 DMT family transporter [Bacillus sp. FJAT-42376]
MKKIIFYLAALLSGMALTIEGAIYGELGKVIGKLESSFYNFAAGSILLFILVLFFGKGDLNKTFKVPKWYLLGGLFCVIYLTALIFGIPEVGVGISMIAVIAGQMMASIIIEHFGWLGSVRRRITNKRISAIIIMMIALFFIY